MGNKQLRRRSGSSGPGSSPESPTGATSVMTDVRTRDNLGAYYRDGVEVTDVYDIVNVLGQGHMGEVYTVRKHKESRGTHNKFTRGEINISERDLENNKKDRKKYQPKLGKKKGKESLLAPCEPSHKPASASATAKSILKKKDTAKATAPIQDGPALSALKSSLRKSALKQTSTPDRVKKKSGVRFARCYACKTVLTSRVRDGFLEELMNEVAVMRSLDHPYVLRLHEVYRVKRKVWLITELCTGGDLASRKLREPEVAVVGEQLVRAVAYMHGRGVLHRDLKLENVLWDVPRGDPDVQPTIRIIDFGLSQAFSRATKGYRTAATAYTRTPEQAGGDDICTEGTDMWAIGIMTWIMLAGDFPFLKEDVDLKDKEQVDKLIAGKYQFGITWNGRGISQEARVFVRTCLKRLPQDRWTAVAALDHIQDVWIPAIAEDQEDASDVLDRSISRRRKSGKIDEDLKATIVVQDVERFCRHGRLKKTVLQAMSYSLAASDVGRLREIFLAADRTGTGTINAQELRAAFERVDPAGAGQHGFVAGVFEGVDQDGTGQIHYAEFLAALVESQGLVTMERLAEAFDRIDSEGKGYISHGDLKRILGRDYNKEVVDEMIKEADFKNNGQVDYEELLRLMFDEDAGAGGAAAGDVAGALKEEGIKDVTRESFRSLDGIKIAWPKNIAEIRAASEEGGAAVGAQDTDTPAIAEGETTVQGVEVTTVAPGEGEVAAETMPAAAEGAAVVP